MQHLRSVIVCAMALAFVVVSCQEKANECPEPNHITCDNNPNKNCRWSYKHVGYCPTYWCCSDVAQLTCKCVGITDLGSCTNMPTHCKMCCTNILRKEPDPVIKFP